MHYFPVVNQPFQKRMPFQQLLSVLVSIVIFCHIGADAEVAWGLGTTVGPIQRNGLDAMGACYTEIPNHLWSTTTTATTVTTITSTTSSTTTTITTTTTNVPPTTTTTTTPEIPTAVPTPAPTEYRWDFRGDMKLHMAENVKTFMFDKMAGKISQAAWWYCATIAVGIISACLLMHFRVYRWDRTLLVKRMIKVCTVVALLVSLLCMILLIVSVLEVLNGFDFNAFGTVAVTFMADFDFLSRKAYFNVNDDLTWGLRMGNPAYHNLEVRDCNIKLGSLSATLSDLLLFSPEEEAGCLRISIPAVRDAVWFLPYEILKVTFAGNTPYELPVEIELAGVWAGSDFRVWLVLRIPMILKYLVDNGNVGGEMAMAAGLAHMTAVGRSFIDISSTMESPLITRLQLFFGVLGTLFFLCGHCCGLCCYTKSRRFYQTMDRQYSRERDKDSSNTDAFFQTLPELNTQKTIFRSAQQQPGSSSSVGNSSAARPKAVTPNGAHVSDESAAGSAARPRVGTGGVILEHLSCSAAKPQVLLSGVSVQEQVEQPVSLRFNGSDHSHDLSKEVVLTLADPRSEHRSNPEQVVLTKQRELLQSLRHKQTGQDRKCVSFAVVSSGATERGEDIADKDSVTFGTRRSAITSTARASTGDVQPSDDLGTDDVTRQRTSDRTSTRSSNFSMSRADSKRNDSSLSSANPSASIPRVFGMQMTSVKTDGDCLPDFE